jgi:hypothetical protein
MKFGGLERALEEKAGVKEKHRTVGHSKHALFACLFVTWANSLQRLACKKPPRESYLEQIRRILIDFRDALGFPGWIDNAKTGWSNLEILPSMNSLGALHGIKVVDEQLREISLPNSNLSGCLPPSFFGLPHLAELRIDGNNVTGTLPNVGSSACLPNLIHIDIRSNPGLVLQIDPEFLATRVVHSACACVLEGPIHCIPARQGLVDIKRECLVVDSSEPMPGEDFIAQLPSMLERKYGKATGGQLERRVQLACSRTSWGGDLYLGVRQQLGGRSFTHTHALTPSRATPDPIKISFEKDEVLFKMHVSLQSFSKDDLDQYSERSNCIMQVEAWLTVHLNVRLLNEVQPNQQTVGSEQEAGDGQDNQDNMRLGFSRELEVQFLRPVREDTASGSTESPTGAP